ncbi:MAG: class I SAM-dependent methyltransferase [Burkholderiaceae bacterium]
MHTFSPDRLLQTGFGFRSAQALLTAVELGLFTELGRGPRSAFQLCRALALDPHAAPDLLDALVAMGVLDRDGDDERAVYLNTRETGHFLDRRSPAYIGAVFESANRCSYGRWAELGTVLRSAPAIPGAAAHAAPAAEPSGIPVNALDTFATRFDFSAHRSLACIGVGADELARRLGARHPQLVCRGIDLHEPGRPVDVIVAIGLLHECSTETRLDLIRRSHAALADGGCLVAIGPVIDDARRHKLFELLASLEARLGAGGACGFSASEFDAWCRDAGFARSEVMTLGETASAAVAHK